MAGSDRKWEQEGKEDVINPEKGALSLSPQYSHILGVLTLFYGIFIYI